MFGRRLRNYSSFADLAAPAKEHFHPTSAKSKGGLIEKTYYQADLSQI